MNARMATITVVLVLGTWTIGSAADEGCGCALCS